MPIYLRNPHSILAVLHTRPQDIFEIRLTSNGGAWDEVRAMAQEIGIKITQAVEKRKQGKDDQRRGGAAEAMVKENPGVTFEELLGNVDSNQGGLWIALDTVQDPHNVGSIFRTAAFFGVRGILITKDRSAPLSDTVYDVASGGVEHIPFSIQTNLSRTLDAAKKKGLWILGSSERADTPIDQVKQDRPWLLVLGNEEGGLRRLTLEKCDSVCKIPSLGRLPSLNVAVAAGILMQRLSS